MAFISLFLRNCVINILFVLNISQLTCMTILELWLTRTTEYFTKNMDELHRDDKFVFQHPRESDWDETCLGDRINGILLQLISCLQNRRCPHYFLPNVDLFKGKSSSGMDAAAKQTWRILRELLTNSRSLEKL